MTSIFDLIGPAALHDYLQLASKFKPIDMQVAYHLATTAIRYYKGDITLRDRMTAGQALEARWYESLKAGTPDYSVYDSAFFVSDLWACWVVYSRKYLLALQSPRTTYSVIPFSRTQTIADLGCGFGYTTAGLREAFPEAVTVYGTQIESTFQFKLAAEVGKERNFTVHQQVQPRTDTIFASEYFEHFQHPVEHLLKIICIAQPKSFILANSFGARSIGHFDEYLHGDVVISNSLIGRTFNQTLRDEGYRNIKTNLWNNRPSIWSRA